MKPSTAPLRSAATPAAALFAAVFALGLLAPAPASAQDADVTGVYDVSGRTGWLGLFGTRYKAELSVIQLEDGSYSVVRSARAGDRAPIMLRGTGTAQRRGGEVRLTVSFGAEGVGVADHLGGPVGGSSGELGGTYRIQTEGRKRGAISGRVRVPHPNGKVRSVSEKGKRAAADAGAEAPPHSLPGTLSGALEVVAPASGAYLVGDALAPEVLPEGATLHVLGGPARMAEGRLLLTGPGQVWLQAAHEGEVGHPFTVDAVLPEVLEVTVLDRIPLADAPAPHYRRARGAAEVAWEPAAILKDQPLRLEVRLAAASDLTRPATVRLTARAQTDGRTIELEQETALQGLGAGQTVQLVSTSPLNNAVAVNDIDLAWSYEASAPHPLGRTRLRVYTSFAAPVDNPMPRYAPTSRQGLPLATKLHFELACAWANGASQNIGQGPDSIAYQVDNRLRHHVAWEDYGDNVPAVPHYPAGTRSPRNYGDLPGLVRRGERGISSLYYPPLEPTKDYQEYRHYRSNFGWWVLDNPQYTGGRCNQQAALISDVLGTLGLRSEVYYIERVARGKTTGRPMRRFYRSSRSERSWNFHGQALVYLDDGTQWLYDGSGSSPPNRINGRIDELMRVPNGPYVAFWHPWRYEDGDRAMAPQSDWPDRDDWHGVPIQPGEEYP